MRKFLVAACLAAIFLCSSNATQNARADHGFYGSGFGNPHCHSNHRHSRHSGYDARYGPGYGHGYGDNYITQYQTAIVPVYRGGIYQSSSFGGLQFGGQPGFGPVGFPYGVPQYGVGYGGANFYRSGYQRSVPRVQLRIGF